MSQDDMTVGDTTVDDMSTAAQKKTLENRNVMGAESLGTDLCP